jgi:hypothetical protein
MSGGCHCGNILLELELARVPAAYSPRACDCDFCRKHCASYVSDPRGALVIRIKDEHQTGKYHQGSGLAELLFCRNCGVLIGALYHQDARIYATVNVNAVEGRTQLAAEQPVSPKELSEAEKVKRWQELWFRNVKIVAP